MIRRALSILCLLATLLFGCNQPFEPNGPLNNTLVVYSILSCRSDTQYVRLSGTTGSPPVPEISGAAVTVIAGGKVVTFRDTTVIWRDTAGNPAPTHVYVAYHAPVPGNALCSLNASTPSGLSASASITSLIQPLLSLQAGAAPGFFALNRVFKSVSGAAVLHFYLDYYALVNNGWELHTEEVPYGRYFDPAGNQVFEYPSFSPVGTLVAGGTTVLIDSALFEATRALVYKRYAPNPVVYRDIRFILTQIDDVLYNYYYLNNGAVDISTVRLDVPVYTNITGGYGVFGSRGEVILLLPLLP